ncbi:MAG: hypothetical protein ACRCYU_19040, partial [Nocardioides sp.]
MPPHSAENPPRPESPTGRSHLERRIGVITLIIVAVVHFGLSLHGLLINRGAYPEWWAQVLAYGMLTVLLAGCAVFLLRGRPLPQALRASGVVAVLGVSALSTADLPSQAFGTSMHWSILVIGWFGVLLLENRLRLLAGFLGLQLLIVVVLLVQAGLPERTVIAGLATAIFSITGEQFGAAVLAKLLRQCASRAERATYEEAQISADRATADQVHTDQKRRFGELSQTVVPLLTGLANSRLDPADP